MAVKPRRLQARRGFKAWRCFRRSLRLGRLRFKSMRKSRLRQFRSRTVGLAAPFRCLRIPNTRQVLKESHTGALNRNRLTLYIIGSGRTLKLG
jgi:hypothetical protein